jgi:excinuclease ABC subunit A
MKAADWIIDVGPGAADEGGRIVATGTPEEIAAVKQSVTGRILREALARDAALLKEA